MPAKNEKVIYKGITFRRYPNSTRRTDRIYYRPPTKLWLQGVGRLHVEIWKDANGPVPDGYHIHHKDGNSLNNDLSNLECVPGSEHVSEHMQNQPDEHWDRNRVHLGEIRPLASEWHKSEEGHQWHVQHSKEIWDNRGSESHCCAQCGATYETRDRRKTSRFCSNKCRTAARLASGVDDEDRICEWCQSPFRINRYKKAQCCSLVCSQRLRRSREAQGL